MAGLIIPLPNATIDNNNMLFAQQISLILSWENYIPLAPREDHTIIVVVSSDNEPNKSGKGK